ncbi:IS4 family transposase [Leptospira ilyithenensis]
MYMSKDVPNEVPKLSLVMRQIGKLGGHLGRKGDGHPGVPHTTFLL